MKEGPKTSLCVEEILEIAIEIGGQMLLCGAEVARVEDSIRRIGFAYGADRVDVFSIATSIYATVEKQGAHATLTRRVPDSVVDLHKLDKLNALSRQICQQTPSKVTVLAQVESIVNTKKPAVWWVLLWSAVTVAGFTMMFGGTVLDVTVAVALGCLLRLLLIGWNTLQVNMIFTNVVTSFVIGLLATFLVHYGIGDQLHTIIVGNIMLMIPGMMLVNGVRDMIAKDLVAGLMRLTEAVILSLSIAIGFWLSASLMGGMLG